MHYTTNILDNSNPVYYELGNHNYYKKNKNRFFIFLGKLSFINSILKKNEQNNIERKNFLNYIQDNIDYLNQNPNNLEMKIKVHLNLNSLLNSIALNLSKFTFLYPKNFFSLSSSTAFSDHETNSVVIGESFHKKTDSYKNAFTYVKEDYGSKACVDLVFLHELSHLKEIFNFKTYEFSNDNFYETYKIYKNMNNLLKNSFFEKMNPNVQIIMKETINLFKETYADSMSLILYKEKNNLTNDSFENLLNKFSEFRLNEQINYNTYNLLENEEKKLNFSYSTFIGLKNYKKIIKEYKETSSSTLNEQDFHYLASECALFTMNQKINELLKTHNVEMKFIFGLKLDKCGNINQIENESQIEKISLENNSINQKLGINNSSKNELLEEFIKDIENNSKNIQSENITIKKKL